ncbi:MAG TPA: RHS repeat-associated core domain-containing protein [Thermoanaerobaculia bacterium]
MHVRWALVLLLLLLFSAPAFADCVAPQTPPASALNLGEIVGKSWQKASVTYSGSPVYSWTLNYRGATGTWFFWHGGTSPHPLELNVSCLKEPATVTLGVEGCEIEQHQNSVGPYDYTPKLYVKALKSTLNSTQALIGYDAPFSNYEEVRIESFNIGSTTPPYVTVINSDTGGPTIGPVEGEFGVEAFGSAFTVVTFTSCRDKSASVVLPGWDGERPCSECDNVRPCNDCTGDPVRTGNGNMRLEDVDPLPASDLFPLRRIYDSRGFNTAPVFGHGWTSIFDANTFETMLHNQTRYRTVITEEGVHYLYRFGGGVWGQVWPSDTGRLGRLEADTGTGEWTHYDPDRRRARVFDSAGRILRYRDLTLQRDVVFTYTNGKITRAADSWGAWAWLIYYLDYRISIIAVEGQPDQSLSYGYAGAMTTVTTATQGIWRKYENAVNEDHGRYLVTAVRDGDNRLLESHTYDGQSRATSSFGPSGEIQSYVHDGVGRVPGETYTRLQWKNGRYETHYSRPVAGRLRTVEISGGCSSCPSGGDAVFGYDATGKFVRKQDARGYVTRYTWDTSWRMLTSEGPFRPAGCDPETDSARCRLNPDSILTDALEATDDTFLTTYTYSDIIWPERPTTITTQSVRNPAGTRTEMLAYDRASGIVTSSAESGWTGTTPQLENRETATALYNGIEGAAFAPGGAFQSSWLSLPQPRSMRKSVDGPRTDVSDVTTFVYYPADATVPPALRGRLAAVRNALNEITRYEDYDLFGNARRTVDARGVVNEAVYDALGRLTSTTLKALASCDTSLDPLCATDLTSTRTYYGAGPILSETRAGGGVTKWTYDARARVESVSRGPSLSDLRERVETAYDIDTGKKNLERVLAWENGAWSEKKRDVWSYDLDGRVQSLVHPGGTFVAYAYGPDGSIASVKDERHAQPNTLYTYHPDGQLATVTQTLGAGTVVTQYGYDLHGNLTSVTDPNGNTTTYVYDDFGQLLQQTSPVTGTTTYSYDASGNLLSTTDANGATTVRTYDALGRVTSAVTTRSGADPEQVTWDYTAPHLWSSVENRMIVMTDPTGMTRYSHDRRGLLIREELPLYTTYYQYDADGNRSAIVYPSGRTVTYTHDWAGRPLTAYDGATALVTATSYLPFGPATSMTLGNGTTRTMTYDTRYRITGNLLASGAGTIASYAYAHDAAGNILMLSDYTDPAYNRGFEYDDLNRLTVANSGSALWGTGSYTYDAMGNLLASSLGAKSSTFTYQSTTPKLVTATENSVPRAVTYDAAGNEATVGARTYEYSARNSLLRDAHLTFAYDGRGVRTRTTSPVELTSLSVENNSIGGGSQLSAFVGLSSAAPAGGIRVALLTDSESLTLPPYVDIAAGNDSLWFTIDTAPVATVTTATIVASIGTTPRSTTVELQPLALYEIEADPEAVVGGDPAEGWVGLNAPAPAGGVIVTLATDNTAVTVPSSVTIPAGEDGAEFTITTTSVTQYVEATLTATYNGGEVSGSLEVLPPDAVSELSVDNALVSGGSTTATVTLVAAAPAGGATVTLSTDRPDLVTVPATVTVPQGQTEAQFVVTSAAPVATSDYAQLVATSGGAEVDAGLQIDPPEIASLVLDPATVEGGQSVTATVTLTAPAAEGTVVQFTGMPIAPLTIAAGTTSASTTFTTEPVLSQMTATLTATLSPWSEAAVLTIEPLAVTLASIDVTPQSVVGSNDATLTVTLTAPAGAGGVEVDLRSFTSTVAAQPPYVIVPAGQTSVSIPVTTSLVATTTTETLRARHVLTQRNATLEVTAPSGNHVAALTLATARAVGGDLVGGTVTLASAAGSGGATITLTSSNPAVAIVPSTLTIAQGDSSGTFSIDTEAVVQPFDVTIRAAYNGTVQRQQLTVVPASQTVTLDSVQADFVYAGDDATGTVTLSGPAPVGGAEVTLTGSRQNGIATVPASVTVDAGQTSATFTITTAPPSQSFDRGALITATYNNLTRSDVLTISRGPELRAPSPNTTRVPTLTPSETLARRSPYQRIAYTTTVTSTGDYTRHHVYTPELNLLAESRFSTSGAPSIEYEYVWFNGEPLAQITTATNTSHWYFPDHLGTPLLQTDATATVVWRVEHEPYGAIHHHRTGLAKHQPLRFPGQEQPVGGELSYNVFRWYRDGWGRYTQVDPVGIPGKEFGYASGNPILNTDVLGLRDTSDVMRRPITRPVCRPVGKIGWLAGRTLGLVGLILSSGGDLNPVEFEASRSRHCDQCTKASKCRPCIPPVGTRAFREDTNPASPPHRGVPPPHWHLYEMHQSPPQAGCVCFWHPINDNRGGFGASPPPPGTVPITPAAGGGLW